MSGETATLLDEMMKEIVASGLATAKRNRLSGEWLRGETTRGSGRDRSTRKTTINSGQKNLRGNARPKKPEQPL